MIDDEGTWDLSAAGVLRLPSGRLLRGRGLRQPGPEDALPQFALYLQAKTPLPVGWPSRWVRWPDWRLPIDRDDAEAAFQEAWKLATEERVEVACTGGRGRTGTALACLAILDGVAPEEAVTYVRKHYDQRAVETPWQRHYVKRFSRSGRRTGARLRILYRAG